MRKKQKKFLVGFGVVIVAIGYLIYTGVTDATMYYLTASELDTAITEGNVDYGENMRLHGRVLTGSIEKGEVGSLQISFIANEGGTQIPIVYTGVVPGRMVHLQLTHCLPSAHLSMKVTKDMANMRTSNQFRQNPRLSLEQISSELRCCLLEE